MIAKIMIIVVWSLVSYSDHHKIYQNDYHDVCTMITITLVKMILLVSVIVAITIIKIIILMIVMITLYWPSWVTATLSTLHQICIFASTRIHIASKDNTFTLLVLIMARAYTLHLLFYFSTFFSCHHHLNHHHRQYH